MAFKGAAHDLRGSLPTRADRLRHGLDCRGAAVSVTINIPGAIRGKGRPKFTSFGGKPRAYTDAKTVTAENWVRACASEAMGDRAPMLFALNVTMAIVVEVPKSWSKAKRAAALAGDLHPTSKPDIDNTVKLACDACNGVVWGDDAQIVRLQVSKCYGEFPRAVLIVVPE